MSALAITPHILEILQTPSVYPVQTSTVELIQTHVSWLLLTDTHVFKFKKPVNFGFLDFSTLELRHFYCLEELRLNGRLCPDIYEQVLALRKTDEGAAFGGDGDIIDFAVVMKRLPADRMLDILVDSGRILTDEIHVIARKIAKFHSKAATSNQINTFGSLEQIRFNWRENFEQTLQFHTTTLSPSESKTIRTYVDSFTSNSALFRARIDNGHIRECDGDIHLGNICLLNGNAYIFDCIEFNERFRYSDTAADIAFLLMDLDYHCRPDLAEEAQAAYIAESGDPDCSLLIPFYKVYRAFVRGKVESLELLDSGIKGEERLAAQKRAIRYFRLAQGYCLRSTLPPTLFITCGTMGSGKSTLANQLAFELGMKTYNSDIVRKQLAGIPPESAVMSCYGEGLYSKGMSDVTYRQLKKLAESQLASGQSVIVDAAFGGKKERSEFAELAASHFARFVIIHVVCPKEEQRRRLRMRTAGGASVSDGRDELLDQHERYFEIPEQAEGRVITCRSNRGQEKSLDNLYKELCLR